MRCYPCCCDSKRSMLDPWLERGPMGGLGLTERERSYMSSASAQRPRPWTRANVKHQWSMMMAPGPERWNTREMHLQEKTVPAQRAGAPRLRIQHLLVEGLRPGHVPAHKGAAPLTERARAQRGCSRSVLCRDASVRPVPRGGDGRHPEHVCENAAKAWSSGTLLPRDASTCARWLALDASFNPRTAATPLFSAGTHHAEERSALRDAPALPVASRPARFRPF